MTRKNRERWYVLLVVIVWALVVLLCPAKVFGQTTNPTTEPSPAFTVSVGDPVRVQEGHPVWLYADDVATGGPLYQRIISWDFGDYRSDENAAPYNNTTGYNSAHIYEQAGTFSARAVVRDTAARQVAVKTWTVEVLRNSQSVNFAASAEQLKTLCAAKPGTIVRLTKPIEIDVTVQSNAPLTGPPTVIDGGGNLIYWKKSTGGVMFATTNTVIRNFKQDAAGIMANAPTFCGAHNRTAIVNVEFRHASQGANCNGKPNKFLMQDCRAPAADSLHAYLAWCEGSELVFFGNYVANSAAEHCLRSGGTDRLALNFNDFTNLDTRGQVRRLADGSVDKADWHSWDIAKQSLTMHLSSRCVAANNKFRGGRVEIGPLGGMDGVKKDNWQTAYIHNAQFLNNVCDFTLYDSNHLEIDHGTDGFLVKGNAITCRTSTPIVVESVDYTTYTLPDGSKRNFGGRNCRNGLITKDNVLSRLDGKTQRVSVPADSTNVVAELR